MKFKALGLAGIALAMYSIPAFAHHSFAMFDADKTVTMKGVVKEFEWVNPHSWLRVTIQDQATGRATQWAFEMGPPQQQIRRGWKPDSLKPGDAVTVNITPGDYVIADKSAVIFIAAADIARVLDKAEMIAAKEAAMADRLRAGEPISKVMAGNYEHMLRR